ncbi:MAG: putative selenium-dependent hydroxylase accessory protein YqeC [Desulfobacterales bacterium]|nr:putative selenium-dependent hydroxylase accessory protein YqeC [Desulfobacterales bacterium]
MNLSEVLSPYSPRIVSVVGGGGKTGFIFTLAREAAAMGKSVLVTTTTAMFNPFEFDTGIPREEKPHPYHRLYTGPAQALAEKACGPGRILVAAADLNQQKKKLIGYTPGALQPVFTAAEFDLILIEADGARMRPVKAPAGHEPVVPAETDTLVGCIGLDCLGRPVAAPWVHRPKLLAKITGTPEGAPVTGDTLVRLAASSQGIFKPAHGQATGHMSRILVLNKADTGDLLRLGKDIAASVVGDGWADLVIITCLRDTPTPVKGYIHS